MKKRSYLLLIVAAFFLYNLGCTSITETYIETDLKPIEGFDQTDIQAVAVLNFDASAIKAKEVDNISLRDAIGYDIIRNLFDQKKIRVIQGQAVQSVQEREVIEATRGDYEAATSTIERLVTYKYNPYQKVDALLTGKVIDYLIIDEDNPGYNYIELLIMLVDSVDGTFYWVSKIRGNYKDVIYTITHTISAKTYTEPAVSVSTFNSLPGTEVSDDDVAVPIPVPSTEQ
ncbi:MAG: hypothetical protein KKH98_14385 [Spirochaetes bacterium]|nr:hypothetical protein [Spirochaetota bacterium]